MKNLILPPVSLLLFGLAAVLLARRWPRFSIRALLASLLVNLVFAMPIVGMGLSRTLEIYPPVTMHMVEEVKPGAIVVLGGGYRRYAPEYGHPDEGQPTLHDRSLARVRYAFRVHRMTGLPILASGGSFGGRRAEADTMAAILTEEYQVDPTKVWIERTSRTTWQNAINSAAYLHDHQVESVILVTSAIHEPRARAAFEAQGIKVLPAPTSYSNQSMEVFSLSAWIPSMGAISETHYAFYEWIGRLWYLVRHGCF
ncbi:MAG: YdcF family protein [Deltaproteobacteria bacterium]|nr:YdcF family protein [Deltaproteobacteria bacterium]